MRDGGHSLLMTWLVCYDFITLWRHDLFRLSFSFASMNNASWFKLVYHLTECAYIWFHLFLSKEKLIPLSLSHPRPLGWSHGKYNPPLSIPNPIFLSWSLTRSPFRLVSRNTNVFSKSPKTNKSNKPYPIPLRPPPGVKGAAEERRLGSDITTTTVRLPVIRVMMVMTVMKMMF